MKYLFVLCMASLLMSCDSGDIIETSYQVAASGKTVKLVAQVSGISDWEETNSVALAGYSGDSQYAVMQRSLSSNLADDSNVELVLSNIGQDVNTVEFVVTNKLRKRILTLASIDMEDYADEKDTIFMNLGTVDVGLLGALQLGFFNKACVQCHGENGRKAAGLDLTTGNTRTSLVDVPSLKKEGETRVVSGDASHSLIYKILSQGGENILHYNHTEVLSSQFKDNQDEVRDILSKWISSLSSHSL